MIVAPYIRVSTQEQAQNGNSISEQKDRLESYCNAMGWTVFQMYIDPGYTGSNMNRPALQKLIQDVTAKRIQKVVVYKLDRLSRSQKDTLELIEDVFLKNHTDFVSMSENFDTSTPFGKAMIGILAVFAQLEREQIKERMNMGKEARAKEGLFRGAWNIPVGYDYKKKDEGLTVNEYEAMQIRRIYDLFLSGTGIKRIVKIMNDSGYRHKYGEWNDNTVRNVMRSRYNLGDVIYKGKWYPGKHPAIIDKETFAKAGAILLENREYYFQNHREGKVNSYLGGLLVCKWCGAKYGKVTAAGKCYYYCNSRHKSSPKLIRDPNCKNKNWKMDELDRIIFDQVRRIAIEPEAFAAPLRDETPEIVSHIKNLESQITRLVELYTVSEIPIEVLQDKVRKIESEKAALEQELDRISDKKEKAISANESQKLAASFDSVLENGSFSEIRTILTSLIDHIELDGDDIDIHWRF